MVGAWRLRDCTEARSTGSSCPLRARSWTPSSFPTARDRSCTAAAEPKAPAATRVPPPRRSGSSRPPMRSGRPTTESGSAGGSRSVEVERKYDVDDSTPLPSWDALPGLASVGEPEVRDLDARYFDTSDHALGRAGYALRRRSGGPDAGWHIK